jgi:hypothetical protein
MLSFLYFQLTFVYRGIGLAVTKILLETFRANVVALSRTKTTDLLGLMTDHAAALLAIECDV